jgi:acyl-[acyl-carrier-protein] desaturase
VLKWILEKLRPIAPEAEKARVDIISYRDRLKKVRDRLAKNKKDPNEETTVKNIK